MTGQQMVLFAVGLMIFAIGGYIAIIQGEVIGVVFMGLATTIFALSTIVGSKAKQDKKDAGNAG